MRGFTLIELLIVVAIIAILAAIAVPNFLEAQTRAKVSRVRSDIRTIALGLEAYRVDNDRYPPHRDNPRDMTVLTTPVSYLTAIPVDPFSSLMNHTYSMTGLYYTWQDLLSIYRDMNPSWGGGDWLSRRVGEGRMWSLSSPGPDLEETMAADATLIYDPTNGTISTGDIYRLGP